MDLFAALKRAVLGKKLAEASITRDQYINSPSPIESELGELFGHRKPTAIFDIGACEGEDSIRYARMFPDASIFAFEPMPGNVEMIHKQLRKYGVDQQVSVFPLALSSSAGPVSFYVSSGSPSHLPNIPEWNYGNKSGSLLAPDAIREHYPWLQFDTTIEVQTETLEYFCDSHGINSIDLIHMDVQGAELDVLRGAGAMLENTRAIWMEVENVPLYEGQPLADEVEAFMAANRFVKIKDTVSSISGDHLYIRQS
jgi:FkbM family methyltransferase